MTHQLTLGLALLCMSVSSLLHAQEEPSFDCDKATSQVEKVLCSGGNSGMGWIDQTMADLYQAVHTAPGADGSALQAQQRAWLAKRNQCKGSDDAVMNCLVESYRARYVELSAPYDQQRLTGWFGSKMGGMEAVLFPDGSLAVSISSNVGAPSYDSCSLDFRAALEEGVVHHVFTPDELGTDDDQCTVDMKVSGSHIEVSPQDCRSMCGNSAYFDGTYLKQR